jgi:hypothetical protein
VSELISSAFTGLGREPARDPQPRAGTAPQSGSDARQPAARSPALNPQGSATADPGEKAIYIHLHRRVMVKSIEIRVEKIIRPAQ